VIDQFADLQLFGNKHRLMAWRQALQRRMSVQQAVVNDYHERLGQFLAGLDSVLGRLFRSAKVRRTA
jgi:hypothetical protein